MTTHPYVAFEGPDGAGKSTAMQAVYEAIERSGRPCYPIGTHSFLDPAAARVVVGVRARGVTGRHDAVTMGYAADLAMHASAFLVPARRHGVVLQSRSLLSVAVYHEALYGIPADATIRGCLAAGAAVPDLVVFVDAATDDLADRVRRRGDPVQRWEVGGVVDRVRSTYRAVMARPDLPPVVAYENARSARWRERLHDGLVAPVLAWVERWGDGRVAVR